jgi:aspartate racemase
VRTIGVLGGMGPAAGIDFYARVVAAHAAKRDQDHPPCILFSATQVPDRTAFLFGDGPDPTLALVAAARTLQAAGADFIAIPCNSAHAFLAAIREAVDIPVLDMIALAAAAGGAEIARQIATSESAAADAESGRPAGLPKVGLLAASGTVRDGLYDGPLRRHGLEPVYPEASVQEHEVMAAIRAVKAGAAALGGASDPRLVAAAQHLLERGAGCLIMGCTEVPLALAAADCPIPALDANQLLAETTLALALGTLDFADCEGAG